MGACSSQKYKKRDSLLSLPTPSNNEQNSPGKLNQENNISKKYAKTTFVLEEINSNFFNKSQSPEKQKSIKSNIRVQLGFLKIYAIIHSNNFKIEIGSERQLKTVQHKYNGELKRMEIITKKGVQVDLLIHQISKIPLNNLYISSITEIFQDFGHFYLLQDHCSGNSLDKVSGRLTECQIARVLIQMINAIDYLHSKNMYHGQLSIDSFQFDSNKNCKLIDVKPIFEKIYPCIYQIGEIEKSKDTFQLGLIAYQLQEGNFIKNDKLSYSIDQLIFKKKISQEFKEILSKMLQNDIGQRISLQTAEFLFTQLLNKPKQSLHIIQKRKIISTILLLLKNNKILRKMQLESKDQKYITQYDLIKMFQHMDNSENIENYIEQLFEEMNIDSYQSIGIHELSTSLLNYSQRLSENKQNKQKSQQNLDESSSISCFADLLMLDEEITNNIISLIITQQFQSKDIIKKIFEMI